MVKLPPVFDVSCAEMETQFCVKLLGHGRFVRVAHTGRVCGLPSIEVNDN